jgi:AcrR family transcriptional regulator
MDAAIQLFHERGFLGTSVRDITTACDLTPGSLYVYFPSKDALLTAIIRQGMAIMDERAAQVVANRDANDDEATLGELVDVYVWYATQYQQLAHVADLFWRQLASTERQGALQVRRRITQNFVEAIERGVKAKRFTPLESGEIRLIAVALLGMMNGILGWYSPAGRLQPEEISEHFQEMALRLVGHPDPRGRSRIPAFSDS